ncbi:MAG TPA: hypothetical protein VKJ67_07275 [Methylomirabilota bacterium]|nr:hypothetical protein [Methylomirabilota bacterium]
MTGNIRGGQAKLIIKKKTVNFPPQKIEKESEVDAQTPKPDHAIQLKLGLRIKQAQQIEALELRPAGGGLMAVHPQPPNDPIAQDLAATLGLAADEKWATFLADYDPAFGTKFNSTLRVSPFSVHDNGFQVVTVAFTHANRTFANDNYLFGLSILPGKNNAALQLMLGGSEQSAKKPAKKAAKKAQTSKKAKAVRKPKKAKGPKRRRR